MAFFKKEAVSTDQAKIDALLSRGVSDVIVLESLKKKLISGKQLRIKLGIDPTSPDLHIGHAVVLRKMREFQDLGHKVVLIIGDYTARIGDPTGKSTTRPHVDASTIKKNMKEYVSQAGKIIDVGRAEIRYNSEWLEKLYFPEIFKLAGLVSVTQMLERNDFSKRLKEHQSIRVHELFYPIMQAYDSVSIKADVELGGNDQLFNNLAGRDLMEKLGLPAQDVLTVPLLEGTDGREKMSKSLGNYIGLTDKPEEMYGKIMSLRDELIPKYFLLCTDMPVSQIEEIKQKLEGGSSNPKDFKMHLAREIVTMYHNAAAATKAEANFVETFSRGGRPENIEEIKTEKGRALADTLVEKGIVASKTEFTRLIREGAISHIDSGEKITDLKAIITEPIELKIGKRRFVKISLS